MAIKTFKTFITEEITSPAVIDESLDIISEAIAITSLETVSKLVSAYLGRKLSTPFYHYPEVEQFKNSTGKGFGVRFFFGRKSIRFNWKTPKINTATLSSVDVWEGGSRAIDYHLEFDADVSLVKSLPFIAEFLAEPKLGVLEYNTQTALHEFIIDEDDGVISESDDPQFDQVIDLFNDGEAVETQGLKASVYQIYLAIRKEYPTYFEKVGKKTIFHGNPKFFIQNQTAVSEKIGRVKVRVTRGATTETYTPSPEVVKMEENKDKLSYEMQLKDLANLTRLVATGASNALFVGGRAGVGKTHVVEETLHSMGLEDGAGYFKNTGTASPIGLFILLYEHRNGILLFDDSDGALNDQDGRNLIKAATDTKKVRKLVYSKKSSFLIDPEEYDEDDPATGTYPRYFDFKGRVIFISNLPMNKLDPDGALRSRSFIIDFNPSDMELLEFMKKLAPTFPLAEGMHLSVKDRMEVIGVLENSKSKNTLSLRKLERALNIRASLGASGDWKHLIQYYS